MFLLVGFSMWMNMDISILAFATYVSIFLDLCTMSDLVMKLMYAYLLLLFLYIGF